MIKLFRKILQNLSLEWETSKDSIYPLGGISNCPIRDKLWVENKKRKSFVPLGTI